MAKKEKDQKNEEMTLAEAKAFRASLNKPKAIELSNEQIREEFRKFWAQEKSKYGKSRDLEEILWLHLKAIKKASPEQFEAGLNHFGLKKVVR